MCERETDGESERVREGHGKIVRQRKREREGHRKVV